MTGDRAHRETEPRVCTAHPLAVPLTSTSVQTRLLLATLTEPHRRPSRLGSRLLRVPGRGHRGHLPPGTRHGTPTWHTTWHTPWHGHASQKDSRARPKLGWVFSDEFIKLPGCY